MEDEIIRQREETTEQIKALEALKEMAGAMDLTFPIRLKMHMRQYSGHILPF